MALFAKFTDTETEHVNRIIDRVQTLVGPQMPLTRLDLLLDLSAAHKHCPLRIADLAGADDFNLLHDVLGIHRHLNRSTGRLENHFFPRFAEVR